MRLALALHVGLGGCSSRSFPTISERTSGIVVEAGEEWQAEAARVPFGKKSIEVRDVGAAELVDAGLEVAEARNELVVVS